MNERGWVKPEVMQAQGQKPSTALAKRQQEIAAMPDNPVTALFKAFDPARYNVLAPVTHMAGLPAGTKIAVTEVKINPDASAKEVFPIAGGTKLLSKVSLDRIAAAAGISWLEERRQDNGAHPHYCEMLVRGKVTDFDGTVRECTGVKAIDLRTDAGGGIYGKDLDEIVTKAGDKRDPTSQITEARKFIQEIAASKAKNRAIASCLALKRSYTDEELSRAFVIPKLSIDASAPAAQTAIMANMLGAAAALFGHEEPKKIVDAEFEEAGQTRAGGSAAGAGSDLPHPAPAAATGPEPAHDKNGEVVGSRETLDAIKNLWLNARELGMPPEQFKALCESATGKASKSLMTAGDVEKVGMSLEAYKANSDDSCPV